MIKVIENGHINRIFSSFFNTIVNCLQQSGDIIEGIYNIAFKCIIRIMKRKSNQFAEVNIA